MSDAPAFEATKDELLEILKRQLVKAEKWDADNLAQHAKDTKEAVKVFRTKLREAMKWDWDEIKAHGHKAGLEHNYRTSEVPTCPNQMATQIKWAIKSLENDSRKRIRLSGGGQNGRMHYLATWDPTIKDEAC